jgi:hypothetical protein
VAASKFTYLTGILILAGALFFYWKFNPQEWDFFPKCPFYHLTGYQCSGCGSQRAIHSLLHLNFPEAFRQNPLVPLALPYLALGFYFDQKKEYSPKALSWRNKLFGATAIKLIFIVVIVFTFLRNLI